MKLSIWLFCLFCFASIIYDTNGWALAILIPLFGGMFIYGLRRSLRTYKRMRDPEIWGKYRKEAHDLYIEYISRRVSGDLKYCRDTEFYKQMTAAFMEHAAKYDFEYKFDNYRWEWDGTLPTLKDV